MFYAILSTWLMVTGTLGLSNPFAMSAIILNHLMVGISAIITIREREFAYRLAFLMELALSRNTKEDISTIQNLSIQEIVTKWKHTANIHLSADVLRMPPYCQTLLSIGFHFTYADSRKVRDVCGEADTEKEDEGFETSKSLLTDQPPTHEGTHEGPPEVPSMLKIAKLKAWKKVGEPLLVPWPDLATAPAYFAWRHDHVRDSIRGNLLILGITDFLGTFLDPLSYCRLSEGLIVASTSLCGGLGPTIRALRLSSALFAIIMHILTWLPAMSKGPLIMQTALVMAGFVRGLVVIFHFLI
ncbi:hypothetical protein BC829DRAFT_249621 [Chytridium lagenaria]|nr:hypothetical protein BC829DRAFT_249621 [Chytridium lagenaria]